MLGYPPTLGVFKRLAHSIALTNPREVPDGAGTSHPSLEDDIKVVEWQVCTGRNNFVLGTSEKYDGSCDISH